MSFDQVFSEYVRALNRFYAEQTEDSYNALVSARKIMHERDATMLEALKELAKSSVIASNALHDIGEATTAQPEQA